MSFPDLIHSLEWYLTRSPLAMLSPILAVFDNWHSQNTLWISPEWLVILGV